MGTRFKLRHPKAPKSRAPKPFKLKNPRAPRGKETDIVSAILDAYAFRKHDVIAFRTNSGSRIVMNPGGGRYKITLCPEGTGDISGWIIPWGVHFECEVKRPGEDQRPSQRDREALIKRTGALYFVAHGVAEALQCLDGAIAYLKTRFPLP